MAATLRAGLQILNKARSSAALAIKSTSRPQPLEGTRANSKGLYLALRPLFPLTGPFQACIASSPEKASKVVSRLFLQHVPELLRKCGVSIQKEGWSASTLVIFRPRGFVSSDQGFEETSGGTGLFAKVLCQLFLQVLKCIDLFFHTACPFPRQAQFPPQKPSPEAPQVNFSAASTP